LRQFNQRSFLGHEFGARDTDQYKKRRGIAIELGPDYIISQKRQCVTKPQMLLLDRASIPVEDLKETKTITDYIESVELYL
jgi:hypothetical protein